MFKLQRNFAEIDGTLYEILKAIPEHQNPIVEKWKEVLMADKCFTKDGYVFFVREVPELEIVEPEPKIIENERNEQHTEGSTGLVEKV